MKHMIALIGDVAGGKSTVAKMLAETLPDYTYLAIDAFRRQHNKEASIVGEMHAVSMLQKSVAKSNKVILETSGTSKYYPVLIWDFQVSGGIVHIAKLTCSIDTVLRRKFEREQNPNYEPAPFAYAHKFSFEESARWIHKQLKTAKAHVEYNTEQDTPEHITQDIISRFQKRIPISTALAKINIMASKNQRFQLTYTTKAGRKKTVLAEVRGNYTKPTQDSTLPILEWCDEANKMVYSSPKIALLNKVDGATIDHENKDIL